MAKKTVSKRKAKAEPIVRFAAHRGISEELMRTSLRKYTLEGWVSKGYSAQMRGNRLR